MINKKIIFIINDFFGHGGHVKSFTSQFKNTISKNHLIICAKNGYISKNLNALDFDLKNIVFVKMDNLRKLQFNIDLYTMITKKLSDNAILYLYSYDCYFSSLFAKKSFKNVSIINAVMGGPNPFPLLPSTDSYIAVSKEQKDYVLKNAYGPKIKEKVLIIKNRIDIKSKSAIISSEQKYVLVVSRFDTGMESSLQNISNILKLIPSNIPIKIAGTGGIIENYKKEFIKYKNIEFLGYCKNIDELRDNACVVLGMGRSILESLLQGNASILAGYEGIELLEDIKSVSYASDYNFAGRKIYKNTELKTCIERIIHYYENNFILNNEIITFLDNEYSIKYFEEKYTKLINNVKSQEITVIQLFLEYIYILKLRLKNKFNKSKK